MTLFWLGMWGGFWLGVLVSASLTLWHLHLRDRQRIDAQPK